MGFGLCTWRVQLRASVLVIVVCHCSRYMYYTATTGDDSMQHLQRLERIYLGFLRRDNLTHQQATTFALRLDDIRDRMARCSK